MCSNHISYTMTQNPCLVLYTTQHTPTFLCHTGGITEAAAMAERLNRSVLVAERLHSCMLSSWDTCKTKQVPTVDKARLYAGVGRKPDLEKPVTNRSVREGDKADMRLSVQMQRCGGKTLLGLLLAMSRAM